MKMDNKSRIISMALAGMVALATVPAQAGIQLVNNFQIRLGNVVGGLGSLTMLDQLGFQGGFQSTTTDVDMSGGLSIGDTGVVDGIFNVTACDGGLCVTDTGNVMGLDYELTGFFRLRNVVADISGPNVTTINDGTNPDSVLELYLDTSLDADPLPDSLGGSGSGMAGPVRDATDPTATLIAVFDLQSGPPDGSVFSTLTQDGSVDSTYALAQDPFGIFFDENGIPLPLGQTLLVTDTNSDADPENDMVLDTTFSGGPFGGTCGATQFENCGTIDGSAIVQRIPEPGILALLGIGLTAMVGFARRRKV